MSRAPAKSADAEHMRRLSAEVLDDEKAEELRREEGKDEAARRQRVKRHLADWKRLHELLEPDSAQEEADECDATLRIQEGDTFEVAMEREVRLVVSKCPPRLTQRSIALRLSNAYDEEYAYALESLPQDAVSAERVYAHLLSYEYLEKHLPPCSIRSVARRATVLLLNRRYLAKTARVRAVESVNPVPPPQVTKVVPLEDPELCLDCGRDVSAPGPGCASCEKTVSGS